MSDIVQRLNAMSIAPSRDSDAFSTWLEPNDALDLLKDNLSDTEFILYAGLRFTFIYGIVVPATSLEPPDVDDLLHWSGNPWSSWSTWYSFGETPAIAISPPLSDIGSQTLAGGEQLIYGRHFDGRQEQTHYFELLQKFTHSFDIHYVPERWAYCRFDKRGDVEDVVRIVHLPEDSGGPGGTIITANRDLIDDYLALTDAAMVRVFDLTRYDPDQFGGWSDKREERFFTDGDLHYRKVIKDNYGIYTRGFQVVRTVTSKRDLYNRFNAASDSDNQYASFISQDWKNDIVTEISCDPRYLSSYFVESDLPYEITPAFFRPDVLLKYKKDPDKYLLEDRSITCRHAWHLDTYDINDAGQVHTYLIYLSRLPYEEQLYWRSFNEAPKGPISKRAFTTDIRGDFFKGEAPLERLKSLLSELHSQDVPWWRLRSKSLIERVHYPVTLSPEEWADELMALDKLLIEGFEHKWLRKKTAELGSSDDIKARPLKLMEECLTRLGFEDEHAREIMTPFHDIHNLRSQLKGHATGKEAQRIRASALSKYRTYRRHFEELCSLCDELMRQIARAFGVSLRG